MASRNHSDTAAPAGRGRRRGVIAGLLALSAAATLGVGVGSASAATVFPTSVTINFTPGAAADVFSGKVSSPNANCVSHRHVVLRRKVDGPDIRMGTDRSEDNGRWSIDVEGGAPAGQYYAKVTAKSIAAGTCAAARSTTITVP